MVKSLMYLLALLCLLNFASCQFDAFLEVDPDILVDDSVATEKWGIMESRVRTFSEEVMNRIFPTLLDMVVSLNISRSCFRDCTKLFLGLRKFNTWAVKFLDASTKSADGILNLQAPSLGSYDECVNNKVYLGRHDEKKGKAALFLGKYCNIYIRPYLSKHKVQNIVPQNLLSGFSYTEESVFPELAKYAAFTYAAPIRGGLCIPSGCSTRDVNKALGRVSDYLGVSVKAKRCAIKEKTEYTPVVVAIMTVYCFTGFLMFLGTIIDVYCDYWKKEFDSTGIQILKAFSFVANFKKLTTTSASSKTGCLNGIRFLSLSWIILAHTTMINFATNLSPPRNLQDFGTDVAFQAIRNANPSVDTFFFLSGFLVCYITTKLVKVKKNSFSIKLYVIHRLWRIIPVYIFAIGFELIKPLTGSGPLFHEIMVGFTKSCEKNWWTNLLFINNFYKQNEMCLPHSWFIAVDVQLSLLALIVLLPLMRWPKVGICLACAIISGCTVVTGVTSYMNNMMAIIFLDVSREKFVYFHNYHNMNPYLHAPPYFIGLLLGYLLATRSDFRIPKVLQVTGWIAAAVTCSAVVYGVHIWSTGIQPTIWEKTIYSALCRPAWTLGVAWMTFCCCTGRSGVINYILSWKMWTPLSRLTYVAYLVHIPVVISYSANMRTALQFDNYINVWIFLGNLVITYAVAFVGYVLIEAPFLSLEKLVFVGRNKEAVSTSNKLKHVKNECEKNDVAKDHTSTKNACNENTGSLKKDFTHV